MKKCTIGLCGMSLTSVNYGVSALGYSHLKLINECMRKKEYECEYIFFTMEKTEDVSKILRELNIENIVISFANSARLKAGLRGIFELIKNFKRCDLVLDVTQGDSFSDIYGYNRFILTSIEKFLAFKITKKLILTPQTIGPFKNKLCADIATYLMNKSIVVYARDNISYIYAKSIAPKAIIKQTSDMAFYLPYRKGEKKDDRIKVGLNVSGLLWKGGYSGKNEFNLTIDYKKFIFALINKLLENSKYDIYLIGHVFLENEGDDDYKVICEIKANYNDNKNIILGRKFKTPIEAKSFISEMDIFIGSRMHSTIAAISSGVATIPVSYSRKFEGLFESIKYDYVINGYKLSNEIALKETLDFIRNYLLLREKAIKSGKIANLRNQMIEEDLYQII